MKDKHAIFHTGTDGAVDCIIECERPDGTVNLKDATTGENIANGISISSEPRVGYAMIASENTDATKPKPKRKSP